MNSFFVNKNANPIFFKKKINFPYNAQFSLMTFGPRNKDKIFYIIKRTPGAGLFSNFIFVINHLKIAKNNNFLPIIDMKNFITIYNEKHKIGGTLNAWEYYFEQVSKYKLENIYKSKNVIITNDRFFKSFTHNIGQNKFQDLSKKYIKIKKLYLDYADKFYKLNLNSKTLAVHYRGTSYKTSANHPFPLTIKQTINHCRHKMKKFGYTKIFLCTEDKELFEVMKNEFSKQLIYLDDSYRSLKDDAFKIYPRKNHRYKLGKEILIESLIISKCKGFFSTNTNVLEFVKFLDKKKKIKYHYMDNGTNSSNEYVAKWLWHYKNLVPKLLGGFD